MRDVKSLYRRVIVSSFWCKNESQSVIIKISFVDSCRLVALLRFDRLNFHPSGVIVNIFFYFFADEAKS